jgi:hypothetical protein
MIMRTLTSVVLVACTVLVACQASAQDCGPYADMPTPLSFSPYRSSEPNGGLAAAALGSDRMVIMLEASLEIHDLANPGSPQRIGVFEDVDPQWPYELEVIGDHAYVSGDDEVVIIDLSDPTDPQAVGTLPNPFGSGMAAIGALLVISSYQGTEVYDCSTPAAPQLLTTMEETGDPIGLASGELRPVASANCWRLSAGRPCVCSTSPSPARRCWWASSTACRWVRQCNTCSATAIAC